jgi:replicative DNA helicase
MIDPTLVEPPHSVEAEQSVLGSLLLANQAYERVSWLTEKSFFLHRHRLLWLALCRMIESGRPADVMTVCDELGEDLEKAGGPAYIGGLAQNVPSAAHVVSYASLVRAKATQRELYGVAMEIAEESLSRSQRDMDQMLDHAESKIFSLGEANVRRGNGPTPIKPLLAKVFERMDELYHRDDHSAVTGVPTGFVDLDTKTDGLHAGDLVIIAGRPSMGKTALALNIAEYAAVDKNLPVVIFSMEMSAAQLTNRLLGSIAHVDQHHMRTGKLNDREWADLTEGMAKLHEVPLHIDESGALTALEVRARARRLKRQMGKLGLIVVDYLQLMESKSKGEHRVQEISEITRSLKAMAKELDCPVIALSQLNRAVDQRPDRRPVMSDLRESGSIEQDADLILFIYREVVYKPDLEESRRALAEVIIGKQRNGPIGTVRLTFLGQYTRFENYAGTDEMWSPPPPRAKRSVVSVDFKKDAAGDRGDAA